jgi:homoserine O-acetyltransferase
MLDKLVERYLSMDANDMIYAFESSRFYNPAPHLAKNKAPLLAVNSADDQVNPPELGLMEKHSVGKKGTYILLPITDLTSGGPILIQPFGKYLEELLIKSEGN